MAEANDQFPEQASGLRIETAADFDDSYEWKPAGTGGGEWIWAGGFLTVEIALSNAGDTPITVPTRPYFPSAHRRLETWPERELIVVSIVIPEFQRTPTKFSEGRFAPVTLAPGETVLVERLSYFTKSLDDAKRIQSVVTRFHVSERFPKRAGWWRGTVGREEPVKKRWMEKPPTSGR